MSDSTFFQAEYKGACSETTLKVILIINPCAAELFLFLINLKLELLTQFPASNIMTKKYVYLRNISILQIDLLDQLIIYHKQLYHFAVTFRHLGHERV